jgi:AraC-like DNA-binding protein
MFYCLAAHVFRSVPGTEWVAGAGAVTGFIFINFLMINSLRQPVVFSGLAADQAALLEEEPAPQFDHALKVRLEQLVHQEKPHLHPNLTLEQLSRKLDAPSREVSRAINQGFGCNFFEFVSRYRIDEAKSRLADAANQENILQIMYESGFNSKSVFNTAFKKETGFTPSEYRRRALQGDIRPEPQS